MMSGRITPPATLSLLDLQRRQLNPDLSMYLSSLHDLSPPSPIIDSPLASLQRSHPSTPEEHRRFLLSVLTAAEALVDDCRHLLVEHEEYAADERPEEVVGAGAPTRPADGASSSTRRPKQ